MSVCFAFSYAPKKTKPPILIHVTLGPTPEKNIPYGPKDPLKSISKLLGTFFASLDSSDAACFDFPSSNTLLAVSIADLYGTP